jgi:hypothetical protein
MDINKKLEELGLTLPNPSKPGGNYVSVNIRKNIAYVAVQFPKYNDEFLYQGRLGDTISDEEGYKAMQLCAINVLAHIDKNPGLDKIVGLNHFDAYYQAGGEWNNAPKIVDGASDLFIHVLGDRGTHSRAILGVEKLARNFSVGLTCTFTIEEE